MNKEGSATWKRLTAGNIGKQLAIVIDGYVFSAPKVNDEIPNGRSSITGNFSVEEAQDLANLMKSGKLPVRVQLVEEKIIPEKD
jgi:SecD/SecF fusion protein